MTVGAVPEAVEGGAMTTYLGDALVEEVSRVMLEKDAEARSCRMRSQVDERPCRPNGNGL